MAPLKKPFVCLTSSRNIGQFLYESRRVFIKPSTAEIIVLDSDDDGPVVRVKRKAHAESSSSDVEVIETEGSFEQHLWKEVPARHRGRISSFCRIWQAKAAAHSDRGTSFCGGKMPTRRRAYFGAGRPGSSLFDGLP